MIKRNQMYFNLLNMLSDAALIFISYMLATYIRFDIMYGASPALSVAWNRSYFFTALVYALITVFSYFATHVYRPQRLRSVKRQVFVIAVVNAVCVVCMSSFLYFTRVTDFSRIAIGMFYVFATGLVSGKHIAAHAVLMRLRNKGYNQKHIVLVGDGKLARQYERSVQDNPQYGFHIIGYVSRVDKEMLGPRLCSYEELSDYLSENDVDSVIIALEPHECQYVPAVIEACEKQGVASSILPFFHDYFPAQPTIDVVGGSKLVNLCATPLNDVFNAFLKRAFDLIASLMMTVLLSPVMLLAAVGTKLSSPGPVIFKQTRVGRGKKEFTMYKFRSMRVNDKKDKAWSTSDDPRKTRFGSFIRKFSIDELPQLFNVIKGEMSLVGPRPELPYFVAKFKEEIPHYMLKHQVRPGMTGLAQINGYRGDTSIEQRIAFDLWYIENWSLSLDIKILIRTALGGIVNRELLAPKNHSETGGAAKRQGGKTA